MIIKIKKDLKKAESLLKSAEVSLERLNLLEISKYPSNSIRDYYDIIHNLLESLCSLIGVKIKGTTAHFELINFISKELRLSEGERIFLQDLRDYRNQISYEGAFINSDYLTRNNHRILELIEKLEKNIRKKISEL